MTFTDEDLKRLQLSSRPMDYVEAMPAIIARLEAAEAYNAALLAIAGKENYSKELFEELRIAMREWHKAAGK